MTKPTKLNLSKTTFENQLKDEIKRLLKQMDLKIPNSEKTNDILRNYLTIRLKLINPKIRKVLVNPNFIKEIILHPKRKEIELIFNIAKSGGNLNYFQSKRVIQSRFHDHLLNEWNIYHFHLSSEKDKKSKFVKQVDSLLFVYITDDIFVILGTDKHKYGIFADTKWIEILHDNFPELISQYKIKHWKDVNPKVNATERQTLWDKGYSLPMTKIRDTVYFSPGGGRMTSGHGMNVAESVNDILRWIYKLTDQINEYPKELCEYLQILPEKAKFKVQFGKEKLELVEIESKIKLLEFPEILIEKSELIKRIKTA